MVSRLKQLKAKKDFVKIQVRVPRNLYTQVRHFLSLHGLTMTHLVLSDLENFVDECKRAPKKGRT